MRAYVINTIIVLIIFPVILQTVINVIILSIGGQGTKQFPPESRSSDGEGKERTRGESSSK